MNNPARFFLALLVVACFSKTIYAQEQPKKILFEAEMGMGGLLSSASGNWNYTSEAWSFHTGTTNYILTARFPRTRDYTNSVFENCWLAGYRIHPVKNFNATISAGAGDLAFVSGYGTRLEQINREAVGLTADVEIQYRFSRYGRSSSWFCYAYYHKTFNDYRNVEGLVFGLGFAPTSIRRNYFSFNREVQAADQAETERLKTEWRKKKGERKAYRKKNGHKIVLEFALFSGHGDHALTGGFEGFVQYRKIIGGMNLIGSYPTVMQVLRFYPNYPPQHAYQWIYQRERQVQVNYFLGYCFLQKKMFSANLAAGPAFRKTSLAYAYDASTYSHDYSVERITRATGIIIQCEQSLTFNRKIGLGIAEYADFYKGYSSAGVRFSLRFGILR